MEFSATTNRICIQRVSKMLISFLICFSIASSLAVLYWSDNFGNKLATKKTKPTKRQQAKGKTNPFEYRIPLTDERNSHRSMVQSLGAELNRSIDMVKVMKLKSKANPKFSSTILIPLHKSRRTHMIRSGQFKRVAPQRTCAVIGNGGILRDSRCGAEIDAHDFVLRSNLAPVTEFNADVGHKTNVMTVNGDGRRHLLACLGIRQSSSQFCEPKYRLNRLPELNGSVLWFSKASSILTKEHRLFVDILRKNNLNISVAYAFRNMAPVVQRFWKVPHPSSGLLLYSVSLPICDMISLYGFYPFNMSSDGRPIKYHYDGMSKHAFNNSHDMPHEYNKLTELSKRGYLRMVTNKCILQ